MPPPGLERVEGVEGSESRFESWLYDETTDCTELSELAWCELNAVESESAWCRSWASVVLLDTCVMMRVPEMGERS